MVFSQTTLWIVIVGLAIGSFFLRFVFLGLIGNRPMPAWILRHLRYTAASLIPAIVTPLVLWPDDSGRIAADPALLVAASVTLAVGYIFKNVLLALAVGAAALLTTTFAF